MGEEAPAYDVEGFIKAMLLGTSVPRRGGETR
jgi:hypothetical protein